MLTTLLLAASLVVAPAECAALDARLRAIAAPPSSAPTASTATSGRPVKLTGNVTTWSSTSKREGDKCSGERTSRTSIRITRLERTGAGARGAER